MAANGREPVRVGGAPAGWDRASEPGHAHRRLGAGLALGGAVAVFFSRPFGAAASLAGLATLAAGLVTLAAGLVTLAAGLVTLASPRAARRIHAALSGGSRLVAEALGQLASLVVFYAVLAPLGAVLRARGRVRLALSVDRTRPSYLEARRSPKSDPSRPL